jgi:hypothetical protein
MVSNIADDIDGSLLFIRRCPLQSKRIAKIVRILRRHNDPSNEATVPVEENVLSEGSVHRLKSRGESSFPKGDFVKSYDLIARDRPNNKSFEDDKFDGRSPQPNLEEVMRKELHASKKDHRHGNHSEENERSRVRVVHWAVNSGKLKNTQTARCGYLERHLVA